MTAPDPKTLRPSDKTQTQVSAATRVTLTVASVVIPFIGEEAAADAASIGGRGLSTGTRYVGEGETALIEETRMVPNTNRAGALKPVYFTPEDPNWGASPEAIKNAYQLPEAPTHIVTLDTSDVTNSSGGNVNGSPYNIGQITDQEIPATGITPIDSPPQE